MLHTALSHGFLLSECSWPSTAYFTFLFSQCSLFVTYHTIYLLITSTTVVSTKERTALFSGTLGNVPCTSVWNRVGMLLILVKLSAETVTII